MAVPLRQGPEENWDDDFEFAQRTSRADGSPPSTPLSRDRKNTLRRWAEAAAPSTPAKRASLAAAPASPPENWDDDFRDSTNSPARTRARPLHHDGDEHENWDDDFADRSPPGKGKAPWSSSDEEEDEEEDEYGLAASEEDRTVTSRSRRIPMHLSGSPPPPVPPLPSPLPHSPTTSVFSMPVSSTGHRDSAAFSTNSHIHLLTGAHSALTLLPPSPPIHRERRRLRKKSRPSPGAAPGVYELDELADDPAPVPSTPENVKRASLSLDEQPPHPEPPQPVTPGPSSGSGSGKTPLLSRIGSVGKKWGAARKKRASTGPNEVTLQEHDTGLHSRPQSVAGNLPLPSSPPPTTPHSKGSWFFRAGGGGGPGPPPPAPVTLEHKTSVDRLLAMAGLDRTPPASPRKGDVNAAPKDADNAGGSIRLTDGTTVPSSALFFGTPKRKPSSRPMSVQAPQMQASSSQGSSSGSSWLSNRPSVPRHASYGYELSKRSATPSSRASSKQRSASASVEDVSRSDRSLTVREGRRERERVQRAAATDSTGPSESESAGHESGKGKEGSRSFMGGMRRISLGGPGKHKRTASKVVEQHSQGRKSSGAATIRAEREPAEETTPRPPSRVIRTSQDAPLLPPIELQPPSPPRLGQRDKSDPRRLFKSHPTLDPSRTYPALSSSRSATPLASRPSGEMEIPSPLPSPTRVKLASAAPGQAASLGRATHPPKELESPGGSAVLRRNSLGDLKIPARISQAQVGLRRDLGMVREFAASIEQLKQLQETYHSLVGEIQSVMYGELPPGGPSRALTPTLFGLPKPPSRMRSNTNPAPFPAPQSPHELILAFHNIESKYQISWECAELLVELGSGAPPHPSSAPTSTPPESASVSTPSIIPDGRKSRERAVTLAGDEPKPILASPSIATSPPLASPGNAAQWRASTGRHDLSSRQLVLLREMLNNPDSSTTIGMDSRLPIPEEEWHSHPGIVNRNWHWGDPMSSTITLPSEDGTQASGSGASAAAAAAAKKEKRKSNKLGMRGIRDMLKSLKKSYGENPLPPTSLSPVPPSTTSISASTESSVNNVAATESWHQSLVQRRRAKTSTGPESMKSTREKDRQPTSPYGTSMSLHRSSPRRPSLASIFRIGQKSKSTSNATNNEQSSDDLRASNLNSATSAGAGRMTEEEVEEDWDQVESAFDLEKAAVQLLEGPSAPDTTGTATVRGRLKKDRGKGKSPYLTQRQPQSRPVTPRSPEASQSSIWGPEPSPLCSTSVLPPPSNPLSSPTSRFKQLTNRKARPPSRGTERSSGPSPSPSSQRQTSGTRQRAPKGPQTGSVRSAPPPGIVSADPGPLSSLSESKLAMTPENIRPLLENAREVHTRCADCILELRALLLTSVQLGGPAPPTASAESHARAVSPMVPPPLPTL